MLIWRSPAKSTPNAIFRFFTLVHAYWRSSAFWSSAVWVASVAAIRAPCPPHAVSPLFFTAYLHSLSLRLERYECALPVLPFGKCSLILPYAGRLASRPLPGYSQPRPCVDSNGPVLSLHALKLLSCPSVLDSLPRRRAPSLRLAR